MPVQMVVRIIREYMRDDGDFLREEFGPQAVTVAQDLKDLLDVRLREESAYEAEWARFLADPEGGAAGLIGALEAQVEADPALANRLTGFVEEYHRAIAPTEGRVTGPDLGESPAGGRVPDTTYTAEDDTTTGEGTYLYDNVPSSGVDSVGRAVGGGTPEQGRQRRIGRLGAEEREVRELFERIDTALELDAQIDPAVRAEVQAAVEEIEAEIGRGAGADVDLVKRRLSTIEELSSRALDTVLDGLGPPAVGISLLPTELVEQLQEMQRERSAEDGD